MIVAIDVRQHRAMSDRLVANAKLSAKSERLDKYTHMIICSCS